MGSKINVEGKKLLKEFNNMRCMAELRVLSNLSLERPLSGIEYQRMMQLKEEIWGE